MEDYSNAPTSASAIDTLSASSARLFQSLSALQEKTSQMATHSTAVAERLSAARSTLIVISAEGEARDGHRIGLHQGQQFWCQQLGAAATEGDWLAIDVVLAAAA